MVPWLALSDQATVFAGKYSFSQPSEQEECIRDWVHRRVGFRPTFGVIFYMGRYDRRLLGIFPVGDVTSYVPAHQARFPSLSNRALLSEASGPVLRPEPQHVAVLSEILSLASSVASNLASVLSSKCGGLKTRLVIACQQSACYWPAVRRLSRNTIDILASLCASSYLLDYSSSMPAVLCAQQDGTLSMQSQSCIDACLQIASCMRISSAMHHCPCLARVLAAG